MELIEILCLKSIRHDRSRILAALQENARVTNVELAEASGVSASPCWRRVRELERTGALRYVTLVDPASVGLPVSAYLLHLKNRLKQP